MHMPAKMTIQGLPNILKKQSRFPKILEIAKGKPKQKQFLDWYVKKKAILKTQSNIIITH